MMLFERKIKSKIKRRMNDFSKIIAFSLENEGLQNVSFRVKIRKEMELSAHGFKFEAMLRQLNSQTNANEKRYAQADPFPGWF